MRHTSITFTLASTTIAIILCISLLSSVAAHGTPAEVDDAGDPEEGSIAYRIANRSYPSVFQAWDNATNLVKSEGKIAALARHDLVWHVPYFFNLVWDMHPDYGLSKTLTDDGIKKGLKMRNKLLSRNPNIILLAALTYRDASLDFLPKDHKWWLRDENGDLILGYKSGKYKAYLLDFGNRKFRKQVALRARALVRSGVVDGVMLDWWEDDPARIKLVRKIRKAIGKDAIILANVNTRKIPKTARYINGCFMECYASENAEDWQVIKETLEWMQKNLREPRITCLNTWYQNVGSTKSVMRAVTTMSLTLSDGYSLFSNYKKLHSHIWYPFLDKSLGKPEEKGVENADGSFSRRYENGVAVYNPAGNEAVTVSFDKDYKSLATGKTAKEHVVAAMDGDIFIEKK